MLSEYDMVCPAFIKFSGSGKLVKSYHTYLEVVLQAFIKGKALHRAVKLGCPLSGTAIYRLFPFHSPQRVHIIAADAAVFFPEQQVEVYHFTLGGHQNIYFYCNLLPAVRRCSHGAGER